MKVTFIYSDLANLKDESNQIIRSNFDLPDAVLQLPDCRHRVIEVATLIGKLTHAVLHISCKELDLKAFQIRQFFDETAHSVTATTRITILRFQRWNGRRIEKRDIKIIVPVKCPFNNPSPQLIATYLLRFQPTPPNETVTEYLDIVNDLAENLQILLNAEPIVGSARSWEIAGFNPYWPDNTLVTRLNKSIGKQIRRTRTTEKQAEKQQRKQTQVTEQDLFQPAPQTGAGRRPGAVPGMFMGVQMRSQLEIRFAAQLQAQDIRWIYEIERVGEEQYLVDFYLPDLGIWVEVKGIFEPRDNYQLPAVALYLQNDRQEQLYVYTQTKAFRVSTDSFASMNHKDFWEILVSKVKSAKSDL